MNAECMTYWPSSRRIYAGRHTEEDPRCGSDLLAAYNDDCEAILKSDSLIQYKGQHVSHTSQNNLRLEQLYVVNLHGQVLRRRKLQSHLAQATEVMNPSNVEHGIGSISSCGSVRIHNNRYSLEKLLCGKIYTTYTDRTSAITNPQTIRLDGLCLDHARNEELAKIVQTGIARGADGGPNPTMLGSITGNHASTDNIAYRLDRAINEFRARNNLTIKYVIMDVDSMSRWQANIQAANSMQCGYIPTHMPNGGVVDLPGLPGIKAIVDPKLEDKRRLYCVTDNALTTIQGPMLYVCGYDNDRDSDVVRIFDCVKHINYDEMQNNSETDDQHYSFLATYA